MLCHTVHNVYKNCLQDGVGTLPGATINGWKKKNIYVGWIRIRNSENSKLDPDLE